MTILITFLLPLVLTYLAYRSLRMIQFLERSKRTNIGFVNLFAPGDLVALALALPEYRPFNIQLPMQFHSHFSWFVTYRSTSFCITSLFPPIRTHFIASPRTAALLSSSEYENKSISTEMGFNEIVDVWGKTLLSSEGDRWKRHRRICSRAFVKTISAAAFGQEIPWITANSPPDGHKLHFAAALKGALVGLITKAVLPKWLLRLTGNTQQCFDELEQYVHEMIASRRALTDNKNSNPTIDHETEEIKGLNDDLLSRLLYASDMEEKQEKKLSTEELLGNIFLFIVAGHETSARTMSFSQLMMALFPEIQEKIFEEVKSCLPIEKDGEITEVRYDEVMDKLMYTRAAIYETLRLWPAVIVLRRKIIADVSVPSFVLPASASLHEALTPTTYTMFKGDKCNLSVFGLHTNPYVWGEDVFEFKPERFLESDGTRKGLRMKEIEKGAFMPFGASSRVCIGRDFAMTEMIAFLATTVRHYRISLPASLAPLAVSRAGESQLDRMERIVGSDVPVTLVHKKVGLEYTRRTE